MPSVHGPRTVHTGLIDRWGRAILRVISLPVGFRADHSQPSRYLVNDDDTPQLGGTGR